MNSRIRTPLNPDYVAAHSLRSLCSNNASTQHDALVSQPSTSVTLRSSVMATILKMPGSGRRLCPSAVSRSHYPSKLSEMKGATGIETQSLNVSGFSIQRQKITEVVPPRLQQLLRWLLLQSQRAFKGEGLSIDDHKDLDQRVLIKGEQDKEYFSYRPRYCIW